MPNVAKVEVDLARDLFTVTPKAGRLEEAALIEAVESVGYGATVANQKDSAKAPDNSSGAIPALVQEALDQARQENKLVLVDFFAEWCGPCQLMLKTTFKAPQVIEELEHFVFLKVDADAHPEIASYFAVNSIPDLRILGPDGREITRVIGFKSAVDMEKVLQEARQ